MPISLQKPLANSFMFHIHEGFLSDLFEAGKKQNNQRVDFFFKVKLSVQLLGIQIRCLLFIY